MPAISAKGVRAVTIAVNTGTTARSRARRGRMMSARRPTRSEAQPPNSAAKLTATPLTMLTSIDVDVGMPRTVIA